MERGGEEWEVFLEDDKIWCPGKCSPRHRCNPERTQFSASQFFQHSLRDNKFREMAWGARLWYVLIGGSVGRGYLAKGCSKCSASRRRPPSRLSSTSPVGFVHRTWRPSGPTQPLTMVSSTSATCNAAFTDPAAAIALRVPAARVADYNQGQERRGVARPEAEEAGRPETRAARLLGWARRLPFRPLGWKAALFCGLRLAVQYREVRKKVRTFQVLSWERKPLALPLVPR